MGDSQLNLYLGADLLCPSSIGRTWCWPKTKRYDKWAST